MDLGRGLALNQVGFGLGLLGSPGLYGRAWVGGWARDDRARVLARSVGARNVALGAGTLLALRRGEDARPWYAAHALAEAADVAVLLAAGSRVPLGARLTGAAMAAATAAVAGVTVVDAVCAQRLADRGRLSVQTTTEGALRVRRRITVNRPPDALYRFWGDFTNAPRFMERVEAVQTTGERRTHWRAQGPGGVTVEWDAEVTEDRPNELIAWRSLDDAPFRHSGVVRFEPAPAGRGTVVTVEMEYAPPGGALTATVAKLIGAAPEQQLQEDLRRFKQFLETGLVVVAQPSASSSRSIAAGGAR
jgi:uncharacterized membrane protein